MAELASLRAAVTAKEEEIERLQTDLALAKSDSRIDLRSDVDRLRAELERVKAENERAWQAHKQINIDLGIRENECQRLHGECNRLRARLEQTEKEREKYEKDAVYHRVKVEDLKEERDAARLNALREAKDVVTRSCGCANAIAALIDAGKPKP